VGPHYAATYRRAFASREILRAHPFVTMVAPVALALAALAAVRWPATVGTAYVAAYVVWSGYHYSGQSLGLALLFPLRQGARLAPADKRLVAVPLYASWVLSLIGLFRLDVVARNPAYELTRQAALRIGARLGLGVSIGAAALAVLAGVVVVGSAVSLAILARRRRAAGQPLPASVVLVVATQLCWFGAGLASPLLNTMLVPVFHGAQYLAITTWHQTRGRGAAAVAAYAVFVIALGLVVHPGILIAGRSLLAAGTASASLPMIIAVVLSFVNLHHFLMDGRIWRLRERRVAESFTAATAAATAAAAAAAPAAGATPAAGPTTAGSPAR